MYNGIVPNIYHHLEETIMRKTGKKLAGVLLTGILAASMVINSFAFYQQPRSKKGLLVNSEMFDDFLDLGCAQMEINQSSAQPENGFLWLAEKSKANNVTVTLLLINTFGGNPDMLPVSQPVDGASVYGFNASTEQGAAAVRDYARRLAAIYKDTVSNWIIGNEVNDASHWDYDGTTDIDAHADAYAKAFRIFYEEITAANPEARVFIPFDHNWAVEDRVLKIDGPYRYRAKDLLIRLNDRLKDLNYGIAWHPYPIDMLNPEIVTANEQQWATSDASKALIVDMNNLDVLTNFMQQPEMLAPDGSVRHLILSEQGFTSTPADGQGNGEERQAAAIRQAYEIANANPYVEAFMLTRHVDARSQVNAGYSFGLWEGDPNAASAEAPLRKKLSWDVYKSLP